MKDTLNFAKEMGHRITIQRKRRGYTQEQLAELADVSPQLISTAETGARTISSEKLYRISNALGVSADYLLTGEFSEKDETYLSEMLNKATPNQKAAIEKICQAIFELND